LRIFTISDIHLDYEENQNWLNHLSISDYQDDVLILSGDVSDKVSLLVAAFEILKKRFSQILFVPGNHDLWVWRNELEDSLKKFHQIKEVADDFEIHMQPYTLGPLSIVPLFGWYDYSFAQPSDELKKTWRDFTACKWPDGFFESRITEYFLSLNKSAISTQNRFIISFSHFLPRIDLMPSFIPLQRRMLYPILGTSRLEEQIRKLGSQIHIYGHTHVNNRINKSNTLYINNALGYPHETGITRRELLCIYELKT